jgi:purine-nucleoside phosphorylase
MSSENQPDLVDDAAPHQLLSLIGEATDLVTSRLDVSGAQAICVLGSGLGGAVEALENRVSLDTSEIPHMPHSTVAGHKGVLHVGTINGQKLLMLQGRVHTYEGVPPWKTTLGIRIAARLGIGTAVLTNSAGAVNANFAPGDLMLITDHINLSGRNPLLGPHRDELGPRFPDMTDAYTPELQEIARQAAQSIGITLHEGIYAWNLGPTYETPAEVRMAATLGADAVGMSTAPETIVARQEGMRILAMSCISNLAAGLSKTPLTHEEVQSVAGPAAEKLGRLLVEVIRRGL